MDRGYKAQNNRLGARPPLPSLPPYSGSPASSFSLFSLLLTPAALSHRPASFTRPSRHFIHTSATIAITQYRLYASTDPIVAEFVHPKSALKICQPPLSKLFSGLQQSRCQTDPCTLNEPGPSPPVSSTSPPTLGEGRSGLKGEVGW